MKIEYILVPLAAYLIGAVPFGLLIGKYHGIDIRKVGSGNIGATNVTRSIGKRAGKLCFFLDFLKGALPVAVTLLLFPDNAVAPLLAGSATIIGHMFPVYLKFKGGKGVSTAAGVALALAPYPLLTAFAIWGITFFASRYVSLASIVAAVALPVAAAVFSCFHLGSAAATSPVTLGFFTAIAILAILRHLTNIKRLLNGTESRFAKKPKAEEEEK